MLPVCNAFLGLLYFYFNKQDNLIIIISIGIHMINISNIFNRKFTMLLGLLCLSSSMVFGQQPNRQQANRNPFDYYNLDPASRAFRTKMETSNFLKETRDHPDSSQEEKDRATKMLKNLWEPTDIPTLFARGIAGSDANVLEGCDIEGWTDAMSKGLLILGTKKLSDVLGRRMENALDQTVGTMLDISFHKFIDICSNINNAILHNGRTPLTQQEIENYKKLIAKILMDVDKMLKDGLKDILRGNDFTARPATVAALNEDKENQDQIVPDKETAPKDIIWKTLMLCYAQQFEKIIQVLEKRKQYYTDTTLCIHTYIDGINSLLGVIKDVLKSSNTLKDFDAALGSSKSTLIGCRNHIEELFNRLFDDEEIKPQNSSLKNTAIRPAPIQKANYARDMMDDQPFPGQFGMGGGIGGFN